MLIFDYSGVAVTAILGHDSQLSGSHEDNMNMARHVIFSTILHYKQKFSEYASDIVIAGDGNQYWRREIFPHYKAKREKARTDSKIPWEKVSAYKNAVFDEIMDTFPYTVIKHPKCEADDVIAIMAEDVAGKRIVIDGLEEHDEKTIIVSDDQDFLQLYKHSNVRQFAPRKQVFLKLETTPLEFIRRKILTGDSGDGIPNVFSPEDSFITGIRQRAATEKKMLPLLESSTLVDGTDDPDIKNRIMKNASLVSFNAIPRKLRREVVQMYNEGSPGTLNRLYDHMNRHNMKHMIKDIDNFRIFTK